jgi:hypothetical protein
MPATNKPKDVWWIPGWSNPYDAIRTENRALENSLRDSILNISKCLQCTKVWEIEHVKGKLKIYYHKDFPTYGLQKNTCPKCKEKNETRQKA